MRNITLAVRMLLKTPFVSAIAILSLALGIGANAAIYSMFDQLLMRKLPVQEPTQLVNLSAPGPMPGSTSCNQAGNCDIIFSYQMFRDLEKGQTSFTGIAAHRSFSVSMGIRNEPVTGDGMMVSGSYFPVLGIQPAKGRLLRPDDDQVIGANFVTVLAYSFWEDAFGKDPNIVGQSMVINGKSFSIVGVAPQGFDGTTLGSQPKVFVPLTMRGELQRFSRWEDRQAYWIYLFARLKPGVSMDAARASINAVYSPIITDVEAPLQKGMSDKTMASFKAKRVLLDPGARYFQRPDDRRQVDTTATSMQGYGAFVRVGKDGGDWNWELMGNTRTPGYEVNDIAFQGRADYAWFNGNIARFFSKPTKWYRTLSLITGGQYQRNYQGLEVTGRDVHAGVFGNTLSGGFFNTFLILRPTLIDERLLRGGPAVYVPGGGYLNLNYGTNTASRVNGQVQASYSWNTERGFGNQFNATVRYRPTSFIALSAGPSYNLTRAVRQYVQAVGDPTAITFNGTRYVLSGLSQNTLGMDTRLSVTFSPRMTFELYAQPFFATGKYYGFKEYTAPGRATSWCTVATQGPLPRAGTPRDA